MAFRSGSSNGDQPDRSNSGGYSFFRPGQGDGEPPVAISGARFLTHLKAEKKESPLYPDISEQRIKAIQKARQARANWLSPDLFCDPAWDILLDLFAAALGGRRMPTGAVAVESGVPPTTILRWITVLDGKGLVVREGDLLDNRRVFIALSEAGLVAMTKMFNAAPGSEGII